MTVVAVDPSVELANVRSNLHTLVDRRLQGELDDLDGRRYALLCAWERVLLGAE